MTQPASSAPPMGAILDADAQGVMVTAVKTAMELDVFTVIAQGNRSAQQIAEAAHCSLRGMTILLDALCPLELLTKSDGCYDLTPTSSTYLVRGAAGYCVPIYLAWLQARDKFADFVRTGKATINLMAPEAEPLWESYVTPDVLKWREHVEIVKTRWSAAGVTPATFPGANILDIGSGSGFKSFTLLLADPAAHATAVDSPKVLDVARRVAGEMGVLDRVTFLSGDVSSEVSAATYNIV